MPNYLRKQRQKALNAEKDNFFDEVTVTMKNEGATEISDFLQQLKRRKIEAKQKREQELKEHNEEEQKATSTRTAATSLPYKPSSKT